MERKIKVRFASGGEKEMTVEEAKRILDETYNDPVLDTIIGGG